jgi:hypothetical protein
VRLFYLIFIVIFLSTTEVFGQSAPRITKITEPVQLDGKLNEAFWARESPYPMTQYEPVFQGKMSEKTEIRMVHDGEFIYIGGKMLTEDPSTIRANTLRRDSYNGDDVFAVVFDPFNDNENGLWFFTTPAGIRVDNAISNDGSSAAGADAINRSWNTFWDVFISEDETGWTVELRIPFSSVGYQLVDDEVEMGVIFYRWIAFHNERHVFPAIPPNWERGNVKPSQAQTITFNGVEASKPLYFTPYTLGGFSRTYQENASGTAFEAQDEVVADIGFDIKYNLTSNLTLDVTANTDFAQVEADEQQLNLTRFSIDFPEKRQFFQQRSGLFDFSFGNTKLFYSRRIGLYDGEQIPIYGGVRLTGRQNKLDIGFMNLQTASHDPLTSENFGVLRLKQQVINENSYFGGIFTSRIGTDGSTNLVTGLDTDINLKGDVFLELKVAQTMDSDVADDIRYNFGENSIFRVTLQRRASLGFFYRFFVNRTGSEFDPGIGFSRIEGTFDYFYKLGYGWQPKASSPVRQNTVEVTSYNILSIGELDVRSSFISGQWSTEFKTIGSLEGQLRYNQEHLLPGEEFNLVGEIFVPEGDYGFVEGELSYRSPNRNALRSSLSVEAGQIFDGERFSFSVQPQWRANIHLDLSAGYTRTDLSFPERAGRTKTDYVVHQGNMKGDFALNKHLSASLLFQISNVSEQMGANMRFRYNFSEGQDLWFVFNQNSYLDRDAVAFGDPRLPKYDTRAFLVKYTYTFTSD